MFIKRYLNDLLYFRHKNRGKLLLLFCSCMALCAFFAFLLVPHTAYAEDVIPVGTWTEFVQGIKDAPDNGTVTTIEIEKDITASEGDEKLATKKGQAILLTGEHAVIGTGLGADQLTVASDSSVTLSGPTFKKISFKVQGELTLKSGGITWVESSYPALMAAGGKVVMYGGSISNNHNTANKGQTKSDAIRKTAPIVIAQGASFTMKDGEISHNRGYVYGGAVLVTDKGSSFTLDSGKIANNTGRDAAYVMAYGGGIFAFNEATATINGGVIEGNEAGFGGGIASYNAYFTMNGGTVQNNKVEGQGGNNNSQGGGIFIFSPQSYNNKILAGTIQNNTAAHYGGGVCVARTAYLYMQDVLVENNTTNHDLHLDKNPGSKPKKEDVAPLSAQGGGIWHFPGGNTTFHINRGIAIFNNKAQELTLDDGSTFLGAGDDFVSFYEKGATKSFSYEAENRMLGGARIDWYKDGSVRSPLRNLPWGQASPRFDPKNPGEPCTDIAKTQNGEDVALKSVTTEDGKELARSLSKISITRNTAGVGGGIAVNGLLEIGDSTLDPWQITIQKVWDKSTPQEQIPDSLEVELYVGEYVADTITLTKKDGWKTTITDFPDPSTLIDKTGHKLPITVREVTDEFEVSIDKLQDDATRSTTFTITNSPKPPTPDTPEEPDKDEPEHKEKAQQKPKKYRRERLPQTGDMFSAFTLLVLGLGASFAGASKVYRRK